MNDTLENAGDKDAHRKVKPKDACPGMAVPLTSFMQIKYPKLGATLPVTNAVMDLPFPCYKTKGTKIAGWENAKSTVGCK